MLFLCQRKGKLMIIKKEKKAYLLLTQGRVLIHLVGNVEEVGEFLQKSSEKGLLLYVLIMTYFTVIDQGQACCPLSTTGNHFGHHQKY